MASMHITEDPNIVDNEFFEPLAGLVAACPYSQRCREFPDEDWVRLGVQRVLQTSENVHAFLHGQGLRFESTPGHSNTSPPSTANVNATL